MIYKPQSILGIPKGDLEGSTLKTLSLAKLDFSRVGRRLWMESPNTSLVGVLLRPSEIFAYVAAGSIGMGFVGYDHLLNEALRNRLTIGSVRRLCDLRSSKQFLKPVRWVFAVPKLSNWHSLDDLRKLPRPISVVTEITFIARQWLKRERIDAVVSGSLGSTEAKAPQFCDAIIDCSHTGASLLENELIEIAEVCTSSCWLIANRKLLDGDIKFRDDAHKLANSVDETVSELRRN